MGVATSACLKIDVDTHVGMRDGVPRLLDILRRHDVRATFFLSFGPDNAGKAVWNVFRTRGFLGKMVRTGAPGLYGLRTALSGTLLPARPIATAFPDRVRRIVEEGHEVASHAWDHRLWQDHLERLTTGQVREQLERAFGAFEDILGRPPRAVAAPAWFATPESLEVQDAFALHYASDMRGGPPCRVVYHGYRSSTLQIPTTQPCLEELLGRGPPDSGSRVATVLEPPPGSESIVVPLHAEVEGGRHAAFLESFLGALQSAGTRVRTLEELATQSLSSPERLPVMTVALAELPGRAGRVLMPV